MADILDEDGDGIDDRIAAHLRRTGWNAMSGESLEEILSSPEAQEAFVATIPEREATALGPQAWSHDRNRLIQEAWNVLPSEAEMTYTPVGYDPVLRESSAEAGARADASSILAQQAALDRMSAELGRPDLAARAGLDRDQTVALTGPNRRAALGEAALGAGAAANSSRLGLVGGLGAAGTERRTQAGNEALTRAAAADDLAVERARMINESRAYGAQKGTEASIQNATIGSRRLGLAGTVTDLGRGAFESAEQRRLEAQREAAQRTRDQIGATIAAGEATVRAVGSATEDDEDERRRPRTREY